MLIKTLAAIAAGIVLATNAPTQSTGEVGVASPYVTIDNEPPPKLIVDPTPLAAGLAHGIVWIQPIPAAPPWCRAFASQALAAGLPGRLSGVWGHN